MKDLIRLYDVCLLAFINTVYCIGIIMSGISMVYCIVYFWYYLL